MQGAYEHLATALDWAQTAGLKVLIDLHGAPGSQNGFDNSGERGPITWGGSDAESVDQTLTAVRKIRDDHAGHPAVGGIEILNEPMGPKIDPTVLDQFYSDGWGNLQNSGVAITIHDAFRGVDAWNNFGEGLADWVLDTHHYEVFDQGQLAMSPSAHISSACAFGSSMTGSNKATVSSFLLDLGGGDRRADALIDCGRIFGSHSGLRLLSEWLRHRRPLRRDLQLRRARLELHG